MKTLAVYVLFFLLFLFFSPAIGEETGKAGTFNLSSPAFHHLKSIPKKFTCDGANVNPPLRIENVPAGTKSLALTLDDRDAPRGTYVHWVLWNIDPGIQEINENSIPPGAVQGMNDFQKNNYGGPCPPTRPHRYVFRVYALDALLNLAPKSTKLDLEKAMEGHVIGRGELAGVYKREKSRK
jgi:hypothetical protein